MKGEFFRPCPKCGRLCNSELDMCEICSGKIAKPEPPKPIIPVVTPVVEPIVEEVAPIVEEQAATEEVIEEVATEENIVEETTDKEKQEVVVPVIETKASKGKGAKGLYALVAVLMLVIVALVVVIMQDKQPDIAVNNTTLQSNTTIPTTLKQETETTTEIIEGTTTENAVETLAPTTTKKAQNTNKETTTKKNTSSTTKETTTKKSTTTTTEAYKIEFNPTIVYSKDEVYRVDLSTWEDGPYVADVKVDNVRVGSNRWDDGYSVYITIKVIKLYEILNNEGDLKEISEIEFSTIKETEVWTSSFILYAYNENEKLYSKERLYLGTENGKNVRPGNTFTDEVVSITEDEIDNVTKYELICEEW